MLSRNNYWVRYINILKFKLKEKEEKILTNGYMISLQTAEVVAL